MFSVYTDKFALGQNWALRKLYKWFENFDQLLAVELFGVCIIRLNTGEVAARPQAVDNLIALWKHHITVKLVVSLLWYFQRKAGRA